MAPESTKSGSKVSDLDLLRRVQRTGGSSLAVTLPKSWTDSMNIKTGDALRFKDLGEGRLELSISAPTTAHPSEQKVLRIQASNSPKDLVSRLLVGAYITGQDKILITDNNGISPELRKEIDRTVIQILGMSIVQEERNSVEVQVFVDPTKHRLPSLLDRVFRMLRLEIDICRQALQQKQTSMLAQIETIENEIDKFSLLMIRQILLASDDFLIAKEVGVPSHHFQLGYRISSKIVEVIGDALYNIAGALGSGMAGIRKLPPSTISELDSLLATMDSILTKAMHLFAHESPDTPLEANIILDKLDSSISEIMAFSTNLPKRTRDVRDAAQVQRVLSSLLAAMEVLKIIIEGMINRSVEPEVIARSGGRPVLTYFESDHK
jgi:phosphate uptake regulator